MTTRIFKYPITLDDAIPMPDGVVVLVGLDPAGSVCVWVQHADPDGRKIDRDLFIVGTGHEVPQPANHLGSFVQGPYVWHVYSPHLERHP